MPRVAFIFRAGAGGWLGGVNYVRNLLTALDAAGADGVEPVLFVASSLDRGVLDGFPPVETVATETLEPARHDRALRVLTLERGRADTALDAVLRRHGIALLSHSVLMGRPRVPAMGWIPDFQHRRLPEQFGWVERRERDLDFRRIARRSRRVIVSSHDAERDLAAFSAEGAARAAVLPFAVAPVDAGQDNAVVQRLGLGRYVHLPNQLWRHKNHALVVEALGLLRQRGSDVVVVATGDGHDHRAPGHREALLSRARVLGFGNRFQLLGRVPYDDMVALMRGAHVLLNPSLFEGWSTTVEEGRALGKRMVLSDLPVHREQDPPGATYFDPRDAVALADALQAAWDGPGDVVDAAQAARAARERHRAFGANYRDLVLATA